MSSIALLGSEEQKERWLPRMVRLAAIGAFALTEPNHGSDSIALETSARRDGDEWVLDGEKQWIGNGTIAYVVVVWARDRADGNYQGVPRREGDTRLRGQGHRGQGLAAVGVERRHPADRLSGPRGERVARARFGKPLAGFQMIQQKLVSMLAQVTATQLYCLRLGRLTEERRFTDTIAALAKLDRPSRPGTCGGHPRRQWVLLDYHIPGT